MITARRESNVYDSIGSDRGGVAVMERETAVEERKYEANARLTERRSHGNL